VANDEGAFVVVPDEPLPAGSGALTIEATAKGEAAPTVSEEAVAVVVAAAADREAVVAIVSPDQPTKVLQNTAPAPEEPTAVAAAKPDDGAGAVTEAAPQTAPDTSSGAAPAPETLPEAEIAPPAEKQDKEAEPAPAAVPAPRQVSLDAVDYDDAGNIVFTGRGEPGHSARIYVDNSHAGDALIAADGRWEFAASAGIAAGVHALRVDGIDGSGRVVHRVEVPFFREETSKVAAATPQEAAPAQDGAAPAATTAAASSEPAEPPPPREGRVVIQPGNNLWRISRVLYGTGTKFTVLFEANREQIKDPDMIYPGQVFKTPDVVPNMETIDPRRREPLKPEEGAASAQ
jgi:hypothetical protein